MTDIEKERALQYAFRKYDSLGPKSLSEARERLFQKIMSTTDISKSDFDDLISDLIEQNKWSESMAMAYFECITLEDRT